MLLPAGGQEGSMPSGYVIFTEIIRDQNQFNSYIQKALPTILGAGGRPLIVQDDPEVIEGQWHGTRTVVLEFDSVEAARKWYHSPDYQSVAGERHACTETNAVIVSGFQMPPS
jgi:uncharacterized protein (DUF1330 family)